MTGAHRGGQTPVSSAFPTITERTPRMLGSRGLEVWGGLECTVVQIGDRIRDQIAETGHRDRIEDLDAIAALGIRTLRYPVLWETVAPDDPSECDFTWHDARMARLRDLGIAPIAGLVHHGSGPRYTGLLDPAFPEMLARHAERVAARYPWVEMFTPINEPLTTARFSGLYGHWAPHGRDLPTFLRCLVTECKAVVLAMGAIRRITPGARLIQTDDMGKTFSTPLLAYQAEHDNERRWLGFDLLCGRVDRTHPWYRAFIAAGVEEADLALFLEGGGTPDIIGINHYLTSERYLDEGLDRYPSHLHGGNGRHRYADVEAVRMDWPVGETGFDVRLREVWERYRLPLAITEAHHGSTRDEQVRWLVEVWNDASRLRAEGVDLRAVTVWSMFGAVDWNSLLVRDTGFYEPGSFDVRFSPPRRTALAEAAEALARTGTFDHPVLDRPGWWHRPERLYMPSEAGRERRPCAAAPRRLLITGATGTLGRAFARVCAMRGLDCDLVGRADMDIADPASVAATLSRCRPWAVVNTAGYVRVADAEHEPERCFRENVVGAAVLGEACAAAGIPYVTFSSDLVFDGRLGRAYVESDRTNPEGVYGASKAEAERMVAAVHPDAMIVRTSAFFGPWDRYNFIHHTLRSLANGRWVEAASDAEVSPTYVPDLVHATLDLLIDGATGVWHLANQGQVSWYELAVRAARTAGADVSKVARVDGGERRTTVLSSERGLILPPLDSAMDRYFLDAAD